MTLVVLAALGIGCALLGAVAGLRPVPRSAESVLRALEGTPGGGEPLSRRPSDTARSRENVGRERGWLGLLRDRAGFRLAHALDDRGWIPDEVRTMTRLAGTTVEALCAQCALSGLAGLLLPTLASAVLAMGGIGVPVVVPLWTGLVTGGAAASAPVLALRAESKRARRAARNVVATFLDLVVLGLAGGMGIESALHAAAEITDNPFSSEIRAALEVARDAGDTPWRALSALGDQHGIDELTELAAAVGLAGTEGARIRATLGAKSASIRRHELADAESEANAVTERLFLPGILLLVGFLVFVGYPAVARIATGF